MWRLRTLPHHLMAFALALIMPVAAGAVFVTYRFSAAERAGLEALMDSVDQDIAALVEGELSTRVATLKALAPSRSLRGGDVARFEAHAREVSRTIGIDIGLFGPNGELLARAGATTISPSQAEADPDLIQAVLATGRVHASNLHDAARPAEAHVHVAMPVVEGDEIIAVLTSTISTARLVELLREGLPEGPFVATILDRAGVVVARSKAAETFVGQPFPQLAAASQAESGSVSLTNPAGVAILVHYRRSGLSGWVVAAAVDRAALTEPLTRSLQRLALVGVGLAVLAGAGAWWFGRKLTRAHASLLAAARLLAEGKVIAAPATPLREVNLVGLALANASGALARQADALKSTNQALEARVAARTRELAAKTALLETTLEAMQQGLVVVDAEGRMLVCNPQARRMLGIPDDLPGLCPSRAGPAAGRVAPGAPPPGIARLLQPRLDADTIAVVQSPVDGPGQLETVLAVQSVALPAGGGIVRTFTDITEHRRHEQELETARDAAEQASRAKGDFVTTMSHEMRTPLNAMIGCSELLLEDPTLGSQARRNAERIQSAGAAMLCLVDDILDIGKIEAGVIDVRAEPFPLRRVAEDALDFVRTWAAEKALALDLSVQRDLPERFVGDPHRLRQVLLNLLNNAIKFTASGGVRLAIAAGGGIDGRPSQRFSVRDTGIGIREADRGKLFHRFQQLDPSVERRFGGAGLGLAISKQLVERMGGAIGVESEFGAGATFWFELPLEPAPPDLAQATAEIRPAQGGARILVAEDVVVNQELARELLEAAGHVVDVVPDGAAAVAAVETGAYDLVLMDLSMPELDGLSATRLIRNCGLAAGATPVVACSANVLPSHVMAFHDAGVDAYLRKPLRRAELHATIDRVLSQARAQADPGSLPAGAAPDSDHDFLSLLGPDRVRAALDGLVDEVRALTLGDWSGGAEREELRGRAHALISTAMVLGLPEMANACRALENACLAGTGIDEALAALGSMADVALTGPDRLRCGSPRERAE